MSNQAAWIPFKGGAVEIGPAEMPNPSAGQLVIENHAIPLHPGDWKLAKGIIPIPITYPAILGNYVAGYVRAVGEGVSRFKKGDRVLSMSAVALRNDHRFGGHQKYTLSVEKFTTHIGNTPFPEATSASIVYAAISALVLHLGLERPSKHAEQKDEKILIWGGGSTLGFFAVQIAAQAGYKVITTASPHSQSSINAVGATKVLDYHSPNILSSLLSLGPYKRIFGASESATDQLIIGQLLAAQGGGTFLSTMGVRAGVVLPEGVTGVFVQYMDDYFKEENKEFVQWVWGEFLEEGLNGGLKLGDVEILGGLGEVQGGLEMLRGGEVRGRKLVIDPSLY